MPIHGGAETQNIRSRDKTQDPWQYDQSSDPWQAYHRQAHRTDRVTEPKLPHGLPKLTIKHSSGIVIHFNDKLLASEFLLPIRNAICASIGANCSNIASLDSESPSPPGQGWRTKAASKKLLKAHSVLPCSFDASKFMPKTLDIPRSLPGNDDDADENVALPSSSQHVEEVASIETPLKDKFEGNDSDENEDNVQSTRLPLDKHDPAKPDVETTGNDDEEVKNAAEYEKITGIDVKQTDEDVEKAEDYNKEDPVPSPIMMLQEIANQMETLATKSDLMTEPPA